MLHIETNYQLLQHNTFGIDVRCSRYVEYASADEAIQVAALIGDEPYIIIGGGSNLLLTRDFNGLVVRSVMKGIEASVDAQGDTLLNCASGETWDDVVAWSVAQGRSALANLSLIPGDVGASAVQNIGAYGAEAAQFIEQVEAVDLVSGHLVTISAKDCGYGYRQSRFKNEWKGRFLITKVVYRLPADDTPHLDYGNLRDELVRRGIGTPTPQQLRDVVIAIRRQKLPDPKELGNAGSFFMNPIVERKLFRQLQASYPQIPYYEVGDDRVKIPAAWLIDQCGWKGRSLGRAGVYSRQPLVLVNLGGATGDEIVSLCRAIQQDVSRRFGIELHPEVNIV